MKIAIIIIDKCLSQLYSTKSIIYNNFLTKIVILTIYHTNYVLVSNKEDNLTTLFKYYI